MQNDSASYALALETSSDHAGVALGRGDEILVVEGFARALLHASGFVPAIASVCDWQGIGARDIKEIFVSCGPGSFTGLRIGVTAARILAWTVNAKVVAVPTLEVIAQNAMELPDPPGSLVVMIDAKRNRVYANFFRRKGDRYIAAAVDAEVDPAELVQRYGIINAAIGAAVGMHEARLTALGIRMITEVAAYPRPEWVYRLGCDRAGQGMFIEPRDLVPSYVRPPEAEERWAARQQAQQKSG